jgi:putative DNA primase/helicase
MVAAPTHRKEAGAYVVQNEHQGIAAWAVEGAARLQRQGQYTVPPSGAALLERWKREADTVGLFVDEKCERCTEAAAGAGSADLYRAYKNWATEQGYRAGSAKTFAHRMETLKLHPVRHASGVLYPVKLKGTWS